MAESFRYSEALQHWPRSLGVPHHLLVSWSPSGPSHGERSGRATCSGIGAPSPACPEPRSWRTPCPARVHCLLQSPLPGLCALCVPGHVAAAQVENTHPRPGLCSVFPEGPGPVCLAHSRTPASGCLSLCVSVLSRFLRKSLTFPSLAEAGVSHAQRPASRAACRCVWPRDRRLEHPNGSRCRVASDGRDSIPGLRTGVQGTAGAAVSLRSSPLSPSTPSGPHPHPRKHTRTRTGTKFSHFLMHV